MNQSSAVPGCTCIDEYMCEACFQDQLRYWAYLRHVPRHMVIDDDESRDELAQELRDAGRGHLVR